MHALPTTMVQLLAPFALVFFRTRLAPRPGAARRHTILAPGKRTVCAALRIMMGLERTEQYQRYHRVLNRALWSSREASRVLS